MTDICSFHSSSKSCLVTKFWVVGEGGNCTFVGSLSSSFSVEVDCPAGISASLVSLAFPSLPFFRYHPPLLGYFLVSQRTSEVWNSISCVGYVPLLKFVLF